MAAISALFALLCLYIAYVHGWPVWSAKPEQGATQITTRGAEPERPPGFSTIISTKPPPVGR